MLKPLTGLLGSPVKAVDGELGSVVDVYFDDVLWMVRYVVADTGQWLPERQTLLSTGAFGFPAYVPAYAPGEEVLISNDKLGEGGGEHAIPVNLTREQVQGSPPVSLDEPVSRQSEEQLATHYGWPRYWESGNPNLRSLEEVKGYSISAKDGGIGHLKDLLVDEDDWSIKYAIIDTRDWLPGKDVLVPAQKVGAFDEEGKQLLVEAAQDEIESAPVYEKESGYDSIMKADRHYGVKQHD